MLCGSLPPEDDDTNIYSSPPILIRQIHHPRFQFASASSIHHMRAIPIRPSLLNSSHANSSLPIPIRWIHHPNSNSPQPPQFITREFITCNFNLPQPPQFITREFITRDSNLLYYYTCTTPLIRPYLRSFAPTSSHSTLPSRIQFAVICVQQ